MSLKRGKCTNFGNCKKADTKEEILVSAGMEFVCPECGSPLTEIGGKGSSQFPTVAVVIVGIVLLLGLGGFFAFKAFFGGKSKPVAQNNPIQQNQQSPSPSPQPTPTPPPQPSQPSPAPSPPPSPPPIQREVVLTLSGSNTIGAKVAPELAKAFIKQEFSIIDIKIEKASETEVSIIGHKPSENKEYIIKINAHGSSTAFNDLETGKADIGMSSRRIKNDEVVRLSHLGDMRSFTNEHIVGLDGLAIIVNPQNPIDKLSIEQIRDIFAGKIDNWSLVGGINLPITVYRRDDKSGTFDTFKHLVMDKAVIRPDALTFEDSRELSRRVYEDKTAIGFIGLPYVESNKTIKVYKGKSIALKPNKLTVKTEDYILSRRLYLYTATNPSNPYVKKFIEFALSKEGQNIVESTGFIGQTPDPIVVASEEQPQEKVYHKGEYFRITKGATQVPINIRFKTGSYELDNKARRDVGRLVELMSRPEYKDKKIILIGFTDNVGSPHMNTKLSKDRADSVKKELSEEGIKIAEVYGLGEEFPIDSNDTEEGREKNRRVEIWLKN